MWERRKKSSENWFFEGCIYIFFCVFSNTFDQLQTDNNVTQAFFYAYKK